MALRRLLAVITISAAAWMLLAPSAALAQTPTATPIQTPGFGPPPPNVAATYRQYVDAINRGDAAGAAAFFTDDGVFIIPGCPAGAGCVGRTAIQSRIQGIVDSGRRFTIVEAQVSGNTLTAREEHRAPVVTSAGVERYIFKGTLTFRGDRISRLVYEFDLSDPQTAAFVAFLQRAAQPTPGPAAPAQVPAPARTGTGGGLIGKSSDSALPGLMGISVLAIAAAAAFKFGPRRGMSD